MKNLTLWGVAVLLSISLFSCRQTVKKPGEEPVKTDTVEARLDALNAAIVSDSLNPERYYERSRFYIDQGQINNALSDINKAIQLNANNADYFVTLSDIYLAMNKVTNCLDALNKAQQLDPKNNDALLKLAEVYLILKNYENTFAYTKMALDNDRINPIAHFIRGYAYMEIGDTNLAVQNFQVAADQDQNYYAAYIELGMLYSTKKDPLAAGYYQTAIRIKPNREEAYYLLGLFYQETDKVPQAVETYEKLLSFSPDYKDAIYNLGYIDLVYTHDFEKAVGYFNRAIELDPNYTEAYFNRGYCHELMGDYQDARQDYRKALAITPNYERSIQGLNRLDSLNE